MNFGDFLDNTSGGGGGGGARIVADIPFNNNNSNSSNNSSSNNNNMPAGAISQPRLLAQSLAKSMFNSPGLSLALVSLKKSIKIESFLLPLSFFNCIKPFL